MFRRKLTNRQRTQAILYDNSRTIVTANDEATGQHGIASDIVPFVILRKAELERWHAHTRT